VTIRFNELIPTWLGFADPQYMDRLCEFPGTPGAASELDDDLPRLELRVRVRRKRGVSRGRGWPPLRPGLVLPLGTRLISASGVSSADSGVSSADSGVSSADSGMSSADSGVSSAEPAVTTIRFAAFCPGGFHDRGSFTALFAGNDPRSWQGGQRLTTQRAG
jgi:hypothetical protein